MFNIALLGAGRIGQVHAANIATHKETTLWSVVDPNETFASRLATQYQARQQSLDEAMTDPDVHAVLIASATDTHADLIELAARHGKAIFCEKPVHLDLARVRDCLKVVKEFDVPLFIGFNRRFDPQFRRVKTEAQSGRIGKPESLLIISRDPSPPPAEYVRVSGGMFRDMTIHDFDMARFIMGEEPVSVYAQEAIWSIRQLARQAISTPRLSCSSMPPARWRPSLTAVARLMAMTSVWNCTVPKVCLRRAISSKTRCSTLARTAAPARCLSISSCNVIRLPMPPSGSTLSPSCAARQCRSAAVMTVSVRCIWLIKRWSHCTASVKFSSDFP